MILVDTNHISNNPFMIRICSVLKHGLLYAQYSQSLYEHIYTYKVYHYLHLVSIKFGRNPMEYEHILLRLFCFLSLGFET